MSVTRSYCDKKALFDDNAMAPNPLSSDALFEEGVSLSKSLHLNGNRVCNNALK